MSMTRRLHVCRVDVLYITSIGCHRGSEARGGGFESRFRPYFLRVFTYSLKRSNFLHQKGCFLEKNTGSLGTRAYFLEGYLFFRRN